MDIELNFQLLFEESPDVLLVLMPDAPRYTMVAATNARLHATHTTRDSLGRGLFEVFPDNPDDPSASGMSNLRASLERVLKTRKSDTMAVQKYDIRGPDGSFEARYWSPKNLPVLSQSGAVLYILHRVEDVTDLVRASAAGDELRGRTREMEREVIKRSDELAVALRELREANAKLAELDVVKTAFFSNISHEFRTPLTLMLGPLEDELSERNHPLPPARRERLDTVHRNSMRLLKLVNALLDFSRIEAGRMQALYEPTDLAGLTSELASHFESALERTGLTLQVDCPSLPEPIYVDREMWEKIVLNLLSNAFKHTFEGGIAVRLAWLGDCAQLTVEDSGVGIAAEEIPRLFDRFHRVKGAASRTHEGTGIGLSLVRELVQLHDGSIRVESELSKGSRFIVILKAGTAHLAADKIGQSTRVGTLGRNAAVYVQEALHWVPSTECAESAPEIDLDNSGPTRAADQSGPRPRIVWADDNADMRHYVTRLLGPTYDVLAVADGQAALNAVREAPPDLLLSDVMMPRLDGFGLLKALRADERTARIPVILLSARAGEEAAVDGLDAGADDYLVKPFSARELLARVRTHLDLARQRREWERVLEQRVAERTAELEQTQQVMMQQERLRALGQMASGIAHDINNAISPISLYTESLLECEPSLSARTRQYLTTIQQAIADVAATVARMREFYRRREPQLTLAPVDLNRAIQQITELTRARWYDMPQRRGVAIELRTDLAMNLPAVMGVESEIRDALTNLIFNAVDAMSDGGTLTLRTRYGAGRIQIEVADTGLGMDENTRRRCLEPFFTTKGERGTGMGLAMVYGMARRHSAEIEIESAPGQGTTVRLSFTAPAEVTVAAAKAPAAPIPTGLRILIVDDDPVLLQSLRDTLGSDGHTIVTANGGQQGIDEFRASQNSKQGFAVVITDLGMPHIDGRQVAGAIKADSPATPVILLTGWGQRLMAEDDVPSHVDFVLSKPPQLRDLREALLRYCSPASAA